MMYITKKEVRSATARAAFDNLECKSVARAAKAIAAAMILNQLNRLKSNRIVFGK